MERPTVGIDLGASYTKVAYRGPLMRHGKNKFATMTTDVVLIDGTATIPSLMIMTDDHRQPSITGADAAGTRPSENMEVFENWKSALYSSEFDANKVKLVTVAGNFFRWLFERAIQLAPVHTISGSQLFFVTMSRYVTGSVATACSSSR